MEQQTIIDQHKKTIARQSEVIENLKAKCNRLTMSNNVLLKTLKDVADMLYDKWDKE
jgi:hypothetical protein